MDLPVNRIAQGNFKSTDVGFDVVDCVFNQRLVSLDQVNVGSGDYVVLAKDNSENKSYVFCMSSDYEFETLNRRALLRGIENKLREVGLQTMELGIMLEREPNVFSVNKRTIRLVTDSAGKCGFVPASLNQARPAAPTFRRKGASMQR